MIEIQEYEWWHTSDNLSEILQRPHSLFFFFITKKKSDILYGPSHYVVHGPVIFTQSFCNTFSPFWYVGVGSGFHFFLLHPYADITWVPYFICKFIIQFLEGKFCFKFFMYKTTTGSQDSKRQSNTNPFIKIESWW